MINALIDLLAGAALAVSFTAIGDAFLGRRSATLLEANGSFLIGSTVTAAVLFPLSLLLGRATLGAILVLAVCLGARWLFLKLRSLTWMRLVGTFAPVRIKIASAVTMFIVSICLLAYGWQNFSYAVGSDGLVIWAWRASLLLRNGALTHDAWPEYGYGARFLSYPGLIPLLEGLMGYLRPELFLSHVKIVFSLFLWSFALSLYACGRRVTGKSESLIFTAAILLLPALTTGTNLLGFADLPLAAVVAAICASALQPRSAPVGFRDPLCWLIAGLLTVKNEGNVLFAIAAGLLVVSLLLSRSAWKPAVVILLSAQLLRTGYLLWMPIPDPTYGPLDSVHLMRALFLWRDIPIAALPYFVDFKQWGFLWILFFPAALLVAWRGTPMGRVFALAATGGLVAYTLIFYFTNWDFEVHLRTAYPRLLEHLAPVAAIVVLMAWTLIGGGPEAKDALSSERAVSHSDQ